MADGQVDRAARGDERGRVVADAGVIGDVVRAGEVARRWRGRWLRLRSGP